MKQEEINKILLLIWEQLSNKKKKRYIVEKWGITKDNIIVDERDVIEWSELETVFNEATKEPEEEKYED